MNEHDIHENDSKILKRKAITRIKEDHILQEPLKKENRTRGRNNRFEWLDQFRGAVIILYIVQTFAYAYSGNLGSGIAPILPSMLNQGYMYAQFSDMPNIITLIDIGQQIFIFLVGFMQGYAVMKRFQKTDEKWRILLHILFRAVLVWFLAAIF
jgi:predicted acyltransferase